MRRLLVIAIPLVTIILFLAVMLSGNFLKQPLGKDDDIPGLIETLIKDIQDEQWDKVNQKAEELNNAWGKVVNRIQFSAERNEINNLSVALARFKGAILEKDRTSAIMELKEAYEHWNQLCQ
ncbi:MAG: DUF4363 family protein [Clostridiaceae bacterium]|nr:DUF4363 family protein [Clostridiaceae bacterium]